MLTKVGEFEVKWVQFRQHNWKRSENAREVARIVEGDWKVSEHSILGERSILSYSELEVFGWSYKLRYVS